MSIFATHFPAKKIDTRDLMDAQPTPKEKIERMVRAAGLTPQTRRTVRDFDLLLADGLSLAPHTAWRRFGIGPNEFPRGCYVTFWWLMKGEDRLFIAGPMFFDIAHNPEYSDGETKRRARLNRATKDAETFVKRLLSAKRRTIN